MTIQERNQHYKNALIMLETGEYPEGVNPNFRRHSHILMQQAGLCELISYSANIWYREVNKENFPELYAHEPVNHDSFWWPFQNRAIRKEVLRKIIDETNP